MDTLLIYFLVGLIFTALAAAVVAVIAWAPDNWQDLLLVVLALLLITLVAGAA